MTAIINSTSDLLSGMPADIADELLKRHSELMPYTDSDYKNLTTLEKDQIQMGTAVPQLYGSLSRYIANPSTVSVETYKRMLDTDETLGSGIDFMNLCMIARFGDYCHPSPEIQEFVRKALENMEGSWHENLDEMFSAEWAGFSVTEQIWRFESDFLGIPAYVPKRLVTYPPLTLVFSVDRHGNMHEDGIHQYQRYYNSLLTSSGYGLGYYTNRGHDIDGFRPDLFASVGDFPYPIRIAADLSYLTVRIPKKKVIHLRSSSTGKFNNPYGRSILRRAYKNWVMKDAFLKMWVIAADRKGTPLIVGYAAPNDTVLSQDNSERGMGAVQPQRADLAMAAALKTIHANSSVVFPGRKSETFEVEAIQVQGDMNVYQQGLQYFNQMLMRSLLLPPLVMGAGDGAGSYSLGQEHHKIFNKSVDGKLKPYKQAILEQFIRRLIEYNFPKSKWEKDGVGEFRLEEVDTDAMEKLANIYGNLTDRGYMSPEDQDDVDEVRSKAMLKKKEVKPLYDPHAGEQMNPLEPKLPNEYQV